jgi:hypothetical protein
VLAHDATFLEARRGGFPEHGANGKSFDQRKPPFCPHFSQPGRLALIIQAYQPRGHSPLAGQAGRCSPKQGRRTASLAHRTPGGVLYRSSRPHAAANRCCCHRFSHRFRCSFRRNGSDSTRIGTEIKKESPLCVGTEHQLSDRRRGPPKSPSWSSHSNNARRRARAPAQGHAGVTQRSAFGGPAKKTCKR